MKKLLVILVCIFILMSIFPALGTTSTPGIAPTLNVTALLSAAPSPTTNEKDGAENNNTANILDIFLKIANILFYIVTGS